MLVILLLILVHTRFIGLDWGLPYPMHPDERNMAVAIEQLACPTLEIPYCLNPKFFAYGQFTLYVAFFSVKILHFFTGNIEQKVTFEQATMTLRMISAISSVATSILLFYIVDMLSKKNMKESIAASVSNPHWKSLVFSSLFIFSPVLIQFAHFGTTESLLICIYTFLLLFSLKLLYNGVTEKHFILWSGIVLGVGFATKVSAAIFCLLPVIAFVWYRILELQKKEKRWFNYLLFLIFGLVKMAIYAFIFFVLLSPYNIISWDDFIGSMNYESAVGLGTFVAFYTHQFVKTIPVVFHSLYIFPYTLGMAVFVAFILAGLLLPWKREYVLFRLAFLIAFLPNAFFFAKWTRFIAPAYPIMIMMAVVFLIQVFELLKKKLSHYPTQAVCVTLRIGFCILVGISLLPGIAYLSVYRHQDVRFTASRWIFENIPANSYILAETANVIDLPIPLPGQPVEEVVTKNYRTISFDFYNLDENIVLQQDLERHIQAADYIIVPSRRVFWNYTCWQPDGTKRNDQLGLKDKCNHLQKKYPRLYNYYEKLFSGQMGFQKAAEFSSLPRITFFGKTLYQINDESAEETWTVFDHPVVRVYKKI